ncbi:MAG: LON peptidase substrate-binding domain-containing protein [Magnetococcales bacterium]|nr:LON peptidase substrate-binding domain-containing protein [Magnetococcales bacterium]
MQLSDLSEEIEIPLFPLHTELLPAHQLALRIFENRYLDMVKQVAGKKESFGIVRILAGNDIGETPTTVSQGVLATIIDFETLSDGLLGITILGGRRFQVRQTWVLNNGLMMGRVAPFVQHVCVNSVEINANGMHH